MTAWLTDWLTDWVKLVTRHAGLCLLLLLLATAGLAWIAATQFRINSDLSELIDQQAPWRADFDRFEATFPDLVRTAVVVVRSTSIDSLERASRAIVAELHDRSEQFTAVAAPGSESFFRDHALLYMDFATLDDTADRLARAQPWLTAVAEDPSLRGVLDLLAEGLQLSPAQQSPEGFADVVQLISTSAQQHSAGQNSRIAWTDEIFDNSELRYQLIYLKAQHADGQRLTDAAVVQALRNVLTTVELPDDVEISLTGEIPLQHEEIEAAVSGVTLAGWLSLALLFLVLLVGVRSAKIIFATFTMLAIGIIWTSAYAMLAVGEYNTLSLVFIVMFFGLGVDFALHFSLRYQEAINSGRATVESALLASTGSVGRAISLCTLTTAVGFLGFWPTPYQGLADLGVISAGGMLVAWFLTFTYLPAFYAVVGAPRAHQMDLPTSDRIVQLLLRQRRRVIAVVILVGLLATLLAGKSTFDYSVLALKDPGAESMRSLRELQQQGLSTDYQLFAMTHDPQAVQDLQNLALVDEVQVPADLVPDDQQEKLYVIEDLQSMLFSALVPQRQLAPPPPEVLRASIRTLVHLLDTLDSPAVDAAASSSLRSALQSILQLDDRGLLAWQTAVVENLQTELQWLSRALTVQPITFDDLPDSLRRRLQADDGTQLAVILPSQDIAQVTALSEFINGVRAQLPDATGRPVIEWGVGQIVLDAFQHALIFAVIGISLILWLALRRVRIVLMILLPLSLTAVCAFAAGVLLDMPTNMANILVLPLIFGLGVDNGIHVVDRYLGEGDVDHLMHSSTPRAVMLSTLTTIGAFAALSLSAHAGTASIGLLLTISVAFLLLFTIFLLPVLLAGKPLSGKSESGKPGSGKPGSDKPGSEASPAQESAGP